MNFFDKIKARKKSKEYVLSPKGAYLKGYCEKILAGQLSSSNYIEAYENEIENIQRIIENSGKEITREETAFALLNILNSIKES